MAPLLLEDFLFAEGEDSGGNGVEGPLKEANLLLIAVWERIKQSALSETPKCCPVDTKVVSHISMFNRQVKDTS